MINLKHRNDNYKKNGIRRIRSHVEPEITEVQIFHVNFNEVNKTMLIFRSTYKDFHFGGLPFRRHSSFIFAIF